PYGQLDASKDPKDTIQRCPGPTAMVQLFGDSSTAGLDYLNGFCQELSTTCTDPTHCTFGGLSTIIPQFAISGEGGFASDSFNNVCGTGQVLVGTNFRTSFLNIEANQGLCADLGQWLGSPAPITVSAPLNGLVGTGGSPGTRMCPHGSVLAGWKI